MIIKIGKLLLFWFLWGLFLMSFGSALKFIFDNWVETQDLVLPLLGSYGALTLSSVGTTWALFKYFHPAKIELLDQEIRELKVRVGELNNHTELSITKSKVLKKQTLQTVHRLRQYLEKRSINEYQAITFGRIFIEVKQILEDTQGQGRNQDITITKIVKELLSKSIACMDKDIREDMAYFNEGLRAETLLLKQELEARLTDSNGASIDFYKKPIMDYKMKSIGTNFIAEIANDLEYLASQLN